MLIQVYVKNEPLEKCDLLIAREDAVISIPVSGLSAIISDVKTRGDTSFEIGLVKIAENMGMKAAILAAQFIASADAVASPVYIACPDKTILDGICSMECTTSTGGIIKLEPYGAKPAAPAKTRTRARASAKPAPAPAENPEPGNGANPDNDQAEDAATAPDEPMNELMDDPSLVQNGEMALNQGKPDTGSDTGKKPDPTSANAPKIMSILKQQGVPSGQIPGVLEALREAMDANITLPMQIKLKLSKDGATGDMDPDKTAKLVAPVFDQLKTLLNEIDDHNAGDAPL